jgi:hypothetical protein
MNRRSILKSLAALALTPFAKISASAAQAKLLIEPPKMLLQYIWGNKDGLEYSPIFATKRKALQRNPKIPDQELYRAPVYYDWKFHEQVFGGQKTTPQEWPSDLPLVLFGEDGSPSNTPEWAKETDRRYDQFSRDRFSDGLNNLGKEKWNELAPPTQEQSFFKPKDTPLT